MPFTARDTDWPLAAVTLRGALTGREWAQLAKRLESWLVNGGAHILILDARALRPPDPRTLRAQARWVSRHREALDERWAGLAVVSGSPVIKQAVRALFALQPVEAPLLFCGSVEDAVAWAKGRLAEAA